MTAGAKPAELVLRDVHVPVPPSWWPPAPGWWMVFVAVLLIAAAAVAFAWRRRHRARSWQRLFDEAARLPQANERIAAISELLRRAARKVDANADRLQGEDWLRFLDGDKDHGFSTGTGRVLLDGGFRRDVADAEVARLLPLARARFLELMVGKR